MVHTLRSGAMALVLVGLASSAAAESLSFKEARKALPKGNRTVAELPDASFLDEKQQAIVLSLKDSIPYFGALALSPDEGLFVEWLNASGQHHSIEAARAAALKHCDSNKKASSAKCVVVLEVSPKGAKSNAPLSLSAEAAAALRGNYRKLKAPKAFAISPSQGTYGIAGGDGARALAACAKSGAGAKDCVVAVAD
ncbi:hypothetical protein BCF46_2519 [Litoreibacter meonggei]|uniref:5-aminolevulic acid synthase n=1 Tax=Litoreibacter meonggei TaxID=1049199 RepID=A0A497VU59_9RHOB|nr:5-aminolevulic acid synthase [Litoreibacter meonggei]RLJ41559.1 hypothetical protein BCF46_2519 [Litoreibacter meonggei]